MTVQQQITKAEQFQQLWQALMPDIPAPDRQQFLLWAGAYSDDQVSRGINRAGIKVRKLRGTTGAMTGEEAARYATSVMRNEMLGIQHHEPGVRRISY